MWSPQDYSVGWVCALPLEMAAAKGMLDQVHPNLSEQDPADHNSYVLGQIQGHNIVIACLPAGIYGTTTAATVAKDMLRTFKSIRFGLMVGIGGGAPSSTQDIRLGDIVVGQPTGTSGGVIQYDRGKTVRDGEFQRTGSLNTPPPVLLAALSRLQAEHMSDDRSIPRFLSELIEKSPKRMKKKFGHQGSPNDCLFRAEYEHDNLDSACDQCDRAQTVQRDARDDTDPVIHYGNIASGNQVIKHGKTRDRLSRELGVLCFEMEAAGLQDFPSLVIRGICDYADSHKNKLWQEYAAATAAAFAKELLSVVTPGRVLQEKPIPQLVSDPRLYELVSRINIAMSDQTLRQDIRYENQKQVACHQAFKTSTYEHFMNLNPDRVPGTCKWVLEHQRYTAWQWSPRDDLLWISADPGCGKSVLAKSLIKEELQSTDKHAVLYFFFKDNEEQNNLATALCALLHQLFHHQPLLLRHAMASFEKNGEKLQEEVDDLWRIFLAAATDDQAARVTCVLDALDECCVGDRRKLIYFLTDFHSRQNAPTRVSRLKFLVTSRPYQDIESDFRNIPEPQSIRLAGEDSNADISEEISLVIKDKVATAGRKLNLDQEVQRALQERLLAVPHRTYLWLHLVIDEILSSPKRTKKAFIKRIGTLSTTIEDAYEKILSRLGCDERKNAEALLHIVVAARRPLTLSEMDVALQIATESPDAQIHRDLDLDRDDLKDHIRKLCGLFVFISDSRVYLIHQTAKEFLVAKDSSPKSSAGLWKHSLDSQRSNTIMTEVCVQYLRFRDIEDDPDTSASPLLNYSAIHWAAHLRSAGPSSESLLERVLHLYDMQDAPFKNWISIFWETFYRDEARSDVNSVHLAALNGHNGVIRNLLDADTGALNVQDCGGQTPLIWGCREGHNEIVKILLDKGAAVNTQGGEYGNALQTACSKGHIEIVKTLLDNGADVNAQGGTCGNALHTACLGNHIEIVKMLLDNDADVNAQDEFDGNALQAACSIGHIEIVKILLDNGADINAQGGEYRNALQAACSCGYIEIFKVLLDNDADVNAQGGPYGNALHAACLNENIEVVKMLLDNGADINAQGGYYGNALQAACADGHIEIFKMLLDNGADVNTQGGYYGNALQAACSDGHIEILKIILNKHADFNTQGGICGNTVQAACLKGNIEIVKVLLNNGADVNAQGGTCGNALQAACLKGDIEVVKMLLDKGADINAQGGSYGNALQAACSKGHDEIVKMLLDKGVGPSTRQT
ncbi:putative ankyrin repeat-containing protein [Diaporthe sp. PMI_573]|nr:putative ankyrin repeat-containing protein [Diaporthaceae sp. PMI_573]